MAPRIIQCGHSDQRARPEADQRIRPTGSGSTILAESRPRLIKQSGRGQWDADELGHHQYAEGLRRGIDHVARLSSVNDGALWIERITLTNFPDAVQIVDWSHASGRLWAVGQALYGEGSEKTKAWVEANLDDLWAGKGWAVVGTLHALNLEQRSVPDEVRQAPGYFESNLARMRYDQFRAQGYPIGSGTVESAGKNVVHLRMRRPGRGWTRDNAQAVLAGLSELHSDRFASTWQHLHHLTAKSPTLLNETRHSYPSCISWRLAL